MFFICLLYYILYLNDNKILVSYFGFTEILYLPQLNGGVFNFHFIRIAFTYMYLYFVLFCRRRRRIGF